MEFIKRTTAPDVNDYHYFSDNIFYQSGYGLPNCTCYCWGRWYELLNEKPRLCINNAKDWYWYNDGYARSQEPKLGAVACYDGGEYGHVAIVEEIYDNGTMLISESDWVQKIYFRTRVIGQHDEAYGGYRLLGFIVPPIDFEPKPQPQPAFESYNVRVTCEVLTVREGAGTEYNWKPFEALTPNAQEQILNHCGYRANGLVEGCEATVLEQVGNWGRIPSGWICLDYTERI